MTETTLATESSATAKVDEANHKLFWTGAAANGALLLALIGFAGSADDPMAALRAITNPMMLSVAGFSFGGAAINFGLARLAQRPLEAIAQTNIKQANRQLASFKDVLTTPPMDADVARLVWGDQAEQQMRALILERLAAAKNATDNSPVLFDEAMQSLKASADKGIAHLRSAQRWLAASFVAAALSVVALVGQAWVTKATAAPMAPIAIPSVAGAALPACPGGASACKPWERAWSKPPPVGTVVPEQVKSASK